MRANFAAWPIWPPPPLWLPPLLACLPGAILLSLLSANGATPETCAIWIDTDLSIGSPVREVDDAYALVVAAHSPALRICGVSSSYGNAPLPATTRRTRDLLNRLGLETPVHPGAAAADELGHATAASEALAHAARKERRLTYVALGPLTNLATFLSLHPERADVFEQIIMVAGKSPGATLGFGPGEKFRIHDANVVKDPAAVRIVLRSRVPILLAPIETSSRLLVRLGDLRRLRESGQPALYLAQKSGPWLWFWTHIARADGGPIFDALAAVAAARPSLLRREDRDAALDADGHLIAAPASNGRGRKVSFVTGFAAETKNFILERLLNNR
ncbi:hypothetical protein BH20VER3_BH20VER3_12730 [soil metagenome]